MVLGVSGEEGVVKDNGSPSDDGKAGAITIDVGNENAGLIRVGEDRTEDVVDSMTMKGMLVGGDRMARSEEWRIYMRPCTSRYSM